MSTNEHDVEYGSNPPGAQYEHTDIDTSVGYKFAVWLTVAALIGAAIVYGTFYYFDTQRIARDAVQEYPLAAGQQKEPPAPRLQTQPFKDVHLLRQGENAHLASYGWVDQPAGVTRIPIDRAMALVVERGLPARSETPAGLHMVPADSSAGRTYTAR